MTRKTRVPANLTITLPFMTASPDGRLNADMNLVKIRKVMRAFTNTMLLSSVVDNWCSEITRLFSGFSQRTRVLRVF